MGIDLRRRNIAVADCGGRDNLPDYTWFCVELGQIRRRRCWRSSAWRRRSSASPSRRLTEAQRAGLQSMPDREA